MTDYDHRPPNQERTHTNRTDPARIKVRTRWFYSEDRADIILQPGERRHAFSRSGDVVESDVPTTSTHMDSISDHVHRAVELFGDDADLVIEVRRA